MDAKCVYRYSILKMALSAQTMLMHLSLSLFATFLLVSQLPGFGGVAGFSLPLTCTEPEHSSACMQANVSPLPTVVDICDTCGNFWGHVPGFVFCCRCDDRVFSFCMEAVMGSSSGDLIKRGDDLQHESHAEKLNETNQ